MKGECENQCSHGHGHGHASTSQRGEQEMTKQGWRHVLIDREGEEDPQVVRCDSVDHVDPANEENTWARIRWVRLAIAIGASMRWGS